MNNLDKKGVATQRAVERIRQERETFEQQKKHQNLWFVLRLAMGFASIPLLASIMVISSLILLNPQLYPMSAIAAAGATLFTDILGLLVFVWKIVLTPTSMTSLHPVTESDQPFLSKEE